MTGRLRGVLAAALIPLAAAAQAPSQGPAAATGNITRGKTLYDKTYRCYACHGYEGQTGTPRLVPMARSQELFVTYLRKPATPAMPAFSDVPVQDLADVYAYIRSLRAEPPAIESIPLLQDILQRSTKP